MKSDEWDKKEHKLDKYDERIGSHNEKVSIMLQEINRCRRNYKILELKYQQLDKDVQFMASKMIQIMNTLKVYNIKV